MKASLSWLNKYVPIEMEINDLADALTMVGLEVESVSDRYEYLNRVVVGRINEINPHPHIAKLKLCNVDVGNRMISIVCGAPNINKNSLAPVALPGTLLSDGTTLEKEIIRGVPSEGMLCSAKELGLGTDRSGIMILDPSLIVGNPLAKALELSDKVLEIDLTPNRPDCLSIIGVGREIAAIQKTRLKYPECTLPETIDNIAAHTSVVIEAPDHCRRYVARLLVDISVEASPFWLQDRLLSVGLRPINNIVDITNFVLLETGQPLHAFDFDRLVENRIVVRLANEGETFTTLDHKERILSRDILMICDGRGPVAIAGVMGGLNSEIEAGSTRVLIESAYFSPTSIRRTSKKIGSSTEASHRFERGVDPEGTLRAANRAAQLMATIAGGRLIEGIIDEHPGKISKQAIALSVKATNRILGTHLDQNNMEDLLKSIEFDVKKNNGDKLTVFPPSFRVDIERPVDLMEEVARLSGYNTIPTTFPLIPAEARPASKQLDIRNTIKAMMTGFGFTEAINYSFISKKSGDHLALQSDDSRRKMVDVLNPLTEDQAVMRTSLIPGLLETVHRNIAHQVRNLKLFEVGKIFISRGPDNLPEEIEMLAGIWTGTRFDASWHHDETVCDFYDIKGVIEGLLYSLNVDNIIFTQIPGISCTYTKPGYTACINTCNDTLGLVGEVTPQVLRNYDLKQAAFIFELNLDTLIPYIPDIRHSKPLPKFPAVARDITIIINKDIESRNIMESINAIDEDLVERVLLFNTFEGDPIPPGKKSISLRIIYRSPKETLEDDNVNQLHRDITDKLIDAFDGMLPR
ncbi:MAG: phenylalanine--tRNA ligase subunit beta [Deltaproteobacteria bacterium]|nr:phenylalanine--tRNA ligase subunit beta [Deltaproteobacteria bacterium]MBW2199309.1 phenylalanine--tRNA ligase subunit beta [Deltaproteobacteria bacterium]MBW2538096.1 phenylalanine--tRNA ligase subunit beta [Deltaproteobacteria bacterium]